MGAAESDYESPEAAALAGWASTPSARAHVVSVEVVNDRAQVVVAADGDPDWVYCVKRNGRWHEVMSGSGPTTGWSDPSSLAWE